MTWTASFRLWVLFWCALIGEQFSILTICALVKDANDFVSILLQAIHEGKWRSRQWKNSQIVDVVRPTDPWIIG
jgi:hypothetical protein